MAIDGKYGKVTLEHGDIGEDEPVVVFRAKDVLLPKVLAYYTALCLKAGSPRRHIDIIFSSYDNVKKWQDEHGSRIPSSENSKNWMS